MIAPDLIGRIPINWSERAGWQVGRMDHWWAVTLAQHLHCSVKFLAVFGQYQLAGRWAQEQPLQDQWLNFLLSACFG